MCSLGGGGGETIAICAKADILSLLNEKRTCAGIGPVAAWTGQAFLCQNRCNLEFSGMRCAVAGSSWSHISWVQITMFTKTGLSFSSLELFTCCSSSLVGIPEFFLVIQVFMAADYPLAPSIIHWGRRFHKIHVCTSLLTVNKFRHDK